MPLDPRIALAGRQPEFSLMDLGAVMAQGQSLQAGQMQLGEQARQLEEAAALREAYRRQFGGGGGALGGGGGAPAGLAGVEPMLEPAGAPVREQQLGGQPTQAFPGGQAPPGGPQAPQGLAGVPGMAGAGAGPGLAGAPGQNRAFLQELYRISPQAAIAEESRQLKQHLDRVDYLGRVSDAVLAAGTQAGHEQGRQMLLDYGMPPGQIPPTYDKNLWQMYANVARDSKDTLQIAQARLYEEQARLAPLEEARQQQQEARLGQAEQRLQRGEGREEARLGFEERRVHVQEAEETRKAREEPWTAEKRALEKDKLELDIQKARRDASGALSPTEQRKLSLDLRQNIRQEPSFKTFSEVRNGVQNVEVGAGRQDAAGDLAIVNGYAKILDPPGVVRPEEFKTVEAAQGFFEQILAMPEKIWDGDRLRPAVRARFLDAARQLGREKQTTAQKELSTVYGPLARDAGLDFDQLLPMTLTERGATARPAAPARSPHADIPVDQMTPQQLDEEEAWLRQQKGAR